MECKNCGAKNLSIRLTPKQKQKGFEQGCDLSPYYEKDTFLCKACYSCFMARFRELQNNFNVGGYY